MRSATIGFIDDYNKVVRRRNLGLRPQREVSVSGAHVCRRRHGAADFANARRVFDAVERAIYEAAAPGPGDRFAARAPVHLAARFRAIHFISRARDCGQLECRESHRRPRRPGDWLRARFVGGADGAHLHFEPRAVRGVSGNSENSRRGRSGNFLRVGGGRIARISLVQRASRRDVHGRCGFARAGRGDWQP